MKALQFLAWMGLAICLIVVPAWAGGLWLYELGNPGTGLASADWGAGALDASTAFTNPAGMTRLPQSELLVGIQPIIPTVRFDAGPGTTTPGGNGGNAGVFVPSGTTFYVYKVNPKLRLGVSALSFVGAGLKYLDGWSGRYYIQQVTLTTLSFVPAAAYKVNDWLSWGSESARSGANYS